MKTISVFLVCILAVALAGKAKENNEESKMIAECEKELGIPDSMDIEESWEGTTEKEKKPCLYFCLFKKYDLMNENGTYNKTALIEQTLSSKVEIVKNAIDNCEKSTKPFDGCKLADCLIRAFREGENRESINFF